MRNSLVKEYAYKLRLLSHLFCTRHRQQFVAPQLHDRLDANATVRGGFLLVHLSPARFNARLC